MGKQKHNVTVLNNHAVTNTIELSLNQNDLVEMAITEQVQLLEQALDQNKQAIAMAKEAYEKARDHISSEIALKKVENDESYKSFERFRKILGIEPHISFRAQSYNNKVVGSYVKGDMMNAEGGKDPVRYFKQYAHEHSWGEEQPKTITITLSIQSNGLSLGYTNDVALTKRETEMFSNKLRKLNEKWLHVTRERYNIQLEYLSYKYGEKKIKSSIVKKSLQKTPEGLKILEMLQSATNIKLLGK